MAGQRLVVWYNTRCPVCDAGINRQQNKLLDAVRAGSISFPISTSSLMRSRPMARRSTTCVTPGEAWLARLFGNPVALPLTRFFYDRFADALFAWNKRKGHW